MILIKATSGRIFGGYTSKSWTGNNEYFNDIDAFVFSVDKNTKYLPINYDKAIFTRVEGFNFGNGILLVDGAKLNDSNEGVCNVGESTFYNI